MLNRRRVVANVGGEERPLRRSDYALWVSFNVSPIVDDSGHVSSFGNNTLTTDSKFGGKALSSGKCITKNTPGITLGSKPFTIDFWYNPKNNYGGVMFGINPNGKSIDSKNLIQMNFAGSSTGGTAFLLTISGVSYAIVASMSDGYFNMNDWNHIAYVKTDDKFMVFVNGTKVGEKDLPPMNLGNVGRIVIGSDQNCYGDCLIKGPLDEFRILVGKARWTEDFTVPDVFDYQVEVGKIWVTLSTLKNWLAPWDTTIFNPDNPVQTTDKFPIYGLAVLSTASTSATSAAETQFFAAPYDKLRMTMNNRLIMYVDQNGDLVFPRTDVTQRGFVNEGIDTYDNGAKNCYVYYNYIDSKCYSADYLRGPVYFNRYQVNSVLDNYFALINVEDIP